MSLFGSSSSRSGGEAGIKLIKLNKEDDSTNLTSLQNGSSQKPKAKAKAVAAKAKAVAKGKGKGKCV
jgi:hypothetical protein